LWSQETPEFDPRVFVTLKAVGRGSSVAFYVNESLLHTVKNAELLSGNTGTIALSTGRFEFDDFSIYLPQMPEAKPA
jgi:hypothetical protein